MADTKHNLIWCLAAALSIFLTARAEAVSLPIDSTTSSLKIELLLFENPIASAQLPGSDVAQLGGTLEVDFPSATEISFPGGSNGVFLNFDNGATPLQPGIGGVAGSAPANYGLDLLLPPASGVAAVRDALADVTGGTESIVGNTFDPSGLTLALTGGILDAFLMLGQDEIMASVDVTDNSAENSNAVDGFADQALGWVIIPINLDVTVEVEIDPTITLPVTARFTGQIATVPVPEPSSLALMGMAAIAFPVFGVGRQRRRR